MGHSLFNEEQLAHDDTTVGFCQYLASSDFGSRIMENWQSEFLQFATFVLATVWLVQRGSSESKDPEKAVARPTRTSRSAGSRTPIRHCGPRVGGVRRKVDENSLFLVMVFFFFLTWFAQSVTAWNVVQRRAEPGQRGGPSWLGYVGTSDFWDRTLQNWQSEFLAVGTMAIFAVYLRQRGSPESKPVGAPHESTPS